MRNKLIRTVLAVVACSSVLAASGTALAKGEVEASYRYWKPSLGITVGPIQPTLNGTPVGSPIASLDAKQALGIQNKNIGDYQFAYNLDNSNQLRLNHFSMSTSGTGTPNFQMGGWNLSAGQFNTTLDLKNTQVSWVRYINKDTDADTTFGLLAGIRSVNIKAISVNNLAGTVEKKFDVVLPCLGFTFETGKSSQFSGFANFSGMYAGSRGHFYDGEIGVKSYLDAKNTVSLEAGYRAIQYKVQNSSSETVDMKVNGPFFSATFKF